MTTAVDAPTWVPMSSPLFRRWKRSLCCACPQCGAIPREWCITDGGRATKRPHADRIARSNGLKRSPSAGSYQRPLASRGGMQWTDAERAAFAAAGLELP